MSGFPRAVPPSGTASGDLSGTYPGPTVARINGSALGTTSGASSGQALVWNGSAWAPGSGGAMALIASSVLAAPAANFTFSSIPGTYNHLQVKLLVRSAAVAVSDNLWLRMNADAAAHYNEVAVSGNGTAMTTFNGAGGAIGAGSSLIKIPAASAGSALSIAQYDIDLDYYALNTFGKTAYFKGGFNDSTTTTVDVTCAGVWNASTTISTLTFLLSSGSNFIVGSAAYLYGIT